MYIIMYIYIYVSVFEDKVRGRGGARPGGREARVLPGPHEAAVRRVLRDVLDGQRLPYIYLSISLSLPIYIYICV